MQKYLILFYTLLIISCNGISEENQEHQKKWTNYNKPLDSLLNTNQKIDLYVSKKNYTLSIIQNGDTLKRYPVVFGTNPIDDKRMEGDRCTPEGKFKMIDKYPHRKWNKFIWINYPNEQSYKKFNTARSLGKIPENATIGGEIGIHGVPKGKDYWIDERSNWTWGCIAMKNSDLNEVYTYINKRSIISIH